MSVSLRFWFEGPAADCSRAFLVAILALAFTACATSDPPSPAPIAVATSAPSATTPSAAASQAATEAPGNPSPPRTSKPPKPTPSPAPPKPAGVEFDTQGQTNADESLAEITQTVTWRAPRTKGVVMRVYGITECIAQPAHPSPATSGPCLVEHTQLPASVRRLLATAPASDGSASWTWTEETGDCNPGLPNDPDGPAYYAVVLAAYGASDHSIFAIAEPGGWYEPGPDDVIC